MKKILILSFLLTVSCTSIDTKPKPEEAKLPVGYWVKEQGNIKFCFRVGEEVDVCSPMPTEFIGLSI